MRQALGAWPAPIEQLEETSSTNDVARQRGREGAPEWTTVIADRQTAGRGRHGRAWMSPPGNLYLSVVLRPPPPAARWTLLPLLCGVAVAEAIGETTGVLTEVKWPNDVLVGGRKLAGILVESGSAGAALDAVVAGIGVNLVSVPAGLPADVRATVTSLAAETGRMPAVADVAAAVLARMAGWYGALRREGGAPLVTAWRARSVAWWGRVVEARSGEHVIRGTAVDVDPSGALVLEQEGGARVLIHSGDVRQVRAAATPRG